MVWPLMMASFLAHGASLTNPILFVTQVPIADDFTTIAAVFGNHKPGVESTGRGGDLYIRYPDGTLRNLTAEAGFGNEGFQGAKSIAVRDPAVDWSGKKAVFSMVVGAATSQWQVTSNVWQLYEITGFGKGEVPAIVKVAHQPSSFNNISPCYGSDGRILFTSDRPRNGEAHLYPQLDEYELAPTVSGLWSLDPNTGDLFQLDHSPSGAFTPTVDSFGRVIFTRWDHLQRDQEADADADAVAQGEQVPYGTFNYADETANALILVGNRTEVFPEPRSVEGRVNRHTFNHFLPWMINQDGTEAETLNHVGRHELVGYLEQSFLDDPNLTTFYNIAARFNTNRTENLLQLKEDPQHPGLYYGIDAPEFSTHASGQIVTLAGAPGLDADRMKIDYITHPETKSYSATPSPNHSGHYREPVPLSDGLLIAVHTFATNSETRRGVGSDYAFRVKTLKPLPQSRYWGPDENLTPGVTKSISYWANGAMLNYSGPLWELNPVEVRARPAPRAGKTPLGAPEQQVFTEEGVSVSDLEGYLRSNRLALVVSRNLTSRDHADRQQPFNLRVAGTATQTLGAEGKVYDIRYLQFFQGDQVRGFGLVRKQDSPRAGRRVLAQPLHESAALTSSLMASAGPVGSVQLGDDGSMAAFVPAQRALTWQLTDPGGTPVVRERFWVTFQPGEIRTCASCHGVNERDQANQPAPVNKPEALRALLRHWKASGLSGTSGETPKITSIAWTENAQFRIQLRGRPTTQHLIQSTRDLVTWTTIGTNTTSLSGTLDFESPSNDLAERWRFYRVVAPSP